MIEQRKIKGSNKNKFSNTKYVYSVENHDKGSDNSLFCICNAHMSEPNDV